MKQNLLDSRSAFAIQRFSIVLFALLFLCTMQLHAHSQGKPIGFNNASLHEAFQIIESAYDVKFSYNPDIIRSGEKVSLPEKERTLPQLLRDLGSAAGLKFIRVGNLIGVQLASRPKMGQPSMITGAITDQSGRPLIGVTVRNENTGEGTVSDQEGKYEIKATAGDALIISYIGYDTKKVKVENNNLINIILIPSSNKLNEAVVIGYGSVLKKDLTGSVATVAAKEIQDVPFTTVDNALAGKVAGVQITKTDGTPGGAVRIRVRGSTSLLGGNDPLYVIDGVPVQVQSNFIAPGFDVPSPVGNDITGQGGSSVGMSTAFVNGLNSIGGLNIDDIEAITILKDASATAIYGSKAANGVVIITTKKGEKGMKPQIQLSYYSTYSAPVTPTLLDGNQYKMLLSEAAGNDYDYRQKAGLSISPELDAIVNHPETYFGKANTDWLDLVTRKTWSHNAELSVRGGSSASKYYASIAYNSTPGVVKNTDYQRVTGKLNMENEIGKHFRFITNLNLGYVTQNIANGAYQQALRARPDYAPYDSVGNFTDFSTVGYSYLGLQNPAAQLTATNQAKTLTLLGSLSGIYNFTADLEWKSTVSLNMQTYNQRNYTPSYLAIGSFYGNVENNGGIGANSNSRLADWFIENTLTYNKTFNESHALNALLGISYETRKSSFFSATASGYPNDDVLNSLSSAVTPLFTKGDDPSKPQSYLLSFYARANYTYRDKYLLTFTGRADGSSKFGPDNKFGYFPSGALAWRISKENFLRNTAWIDEIKLRGSYGLTGTQNIGDQMYRTLYSPYSYGGTSALIPTQLGNPAIKWETTRETDAGIDFSFFNGRLQGTADYYRKQTDGALLSLPVAPSSSYSSLLNNVVNIRNTGYELSLQGDIIRTKDFRWNASVNITWNRSVVTKLNADADLGQIGDFTGLEYENTTLIEGKPLGLITGMKVTGIIKTQKELDAYKEQLGASAAFFDYLSIGDPMFELLLSDGFNFPNFGALIASAAPKNYGGFTQQFTWKNLDLNFYFTFSQGGKLMWGDDVSSLRFVGTSNANASMLKRWTPDNPNSDRPRLMLNDQLIYNTNLSIYNSSYVKLRTLAFSYRFVPAAWMKKIGLASLSAFTSATNLFTITRYPGNDPETSDDPYSVAGGYFDVSNYPSIRSFSLGIKASF